jgi:hypothetical protein
MRTLASKIERGLQTREWKHYAVYEDELQRFSPPTEKDREAKIAQFAKEYGWARDVFSLLYLVRCLVRGLAWRAIMWIAKYRGRLRDRVETLADYAEVARPTSQ